MLEELVKQAVVGTGRAAAALPQADGPLGQALRALDAGTAESKLLSAGAVLAQYETCGRVPAPAARASPAAAVDVQAAVTARAGVLLAVILAMTNTPAKQAVLGEWLSLASAARRRAPHRLLPVLLDYGAAVRALRPAIAAAADARGEWLVQLNPRWQFAVSERVDHRALWETGTSDQRSTAIQRLRESDAAAARALIESTWKQDAADDRAKFVDAMRVSLSDDDEAFLEPALDDRSKQVRAAAADLLARMPGSALVKRMTDRAETLIQFTPGTGGGLLRKGKPAKIEVVLPPEKFDTAWQRDGISEKPDERMGQRQWRLVQVLSGVPPAQWSAKWAADPSSIVTAATANEHADILLRAWTIAAARHPEPAWAAALLRATPADDWRRPQVTELLMRLPESDRLAIAAEFLEASTAKFDVTAQWLAATNFPLDRRCAAAAMKHVERHVASAKGYDYHLPYALDPLALRLPPELHDELAACWTGDAWEANRTTLDKFFHLMALRRDIQREFTK